MWYQQYSGAVLPPSLMVLFVLHLHFFHICFVFVSFARLNTTWSIIDIDINIYTLSLLCSTQCVPSWIFLTTKIQFSFENMQITFTPHGSVASSRFTWKDISNFWNQFQILQNLIFGRRHTHKHSLISKLVSSHPSLYIGQVSNS